MLLGKKHSNDNFFTFLDGGDGLEDDKWLSALEATVYHHPMLRARLHTDTGPPGHSSPRLVVTDGVTGRSDCPLIVCHEGTRSSNLQG
jgi:hypothetical protein